MELPPIPFKLHPCIFSNVSLNKYFSLNEKSNR